MYLSSMSQSVHSFHFTLFNVEKFCLGPITDPRDVCSQGPRCNHTFLKLVVKVFFVKFKRQLWFNLLCRLLLFVSSVYFPKIYKVHGWVDYLRLLQVMSIRVLILRPSFLLIPPDRRITFTRRATTGPYSRPLNYVFFREFESRVKRRYLFFVLLLDIIWCYVLLVQCEV